MPCRARTALFVFFLLFLFRVLLRHQWVAAWCASDLRGAQRAQQRRPWSKVEDVVYISIFAIAVLRWGLTTLAVGVIVADLLLILPATSALSAWYLGEMIIVIGIPVAIAAWGVLHVALRPRVRRRSAVLRIGRSGGSGC